MACVGVLSRVCGPVHYLAQYRGSYQEVVVRMAVPKVNKNLSTLLKTSTFIWVF